MIGTMLALLAPLGLMPAEKLKPHQKALLDGARLIEDKGLTKLILEDDTGFCVQGAVLKVVTGKAEWTADMLSGRDFPHADTLDKAFRALETVTGVGQDKQAPCPRFASWNLAHWNNEPKRTAGEVAAAMRKAAALT